MSNETVSPISPAAALEQYYQGQLSVDTLLKVFQGDQPPPLPEADTPDVLGAIKSELQRLSDCVLVKAGLGGPTANEALEAYYAYRAEADQFLSALRREKFRS
ncbi:MAG: hypothetical protein HYS86_02780 [Candidatus Chisholmbacteria bacterium]|nr:hypothetical protein [Candidatus Chisholmbacteria bacterium]